MKWENGLVDKDNGFYVFYGVFSAIMGLFFYLLQWLSLRPEPPELVE